MLETTAHKRQNWDSNPGRVTPQPSPLMPPKALPACLARDGAQAAGEGQVAGLRLEMGSVGCSARQCPFPAPPVFVGLGGPDIWAHVTQADQIGRAHV